MFQEPVGVESAGSPGVNGHDSSVDTSFHPYPPSRPFINTDYQRSPARPIMSFPESNRDGRYSDASVGVQCCFTSTETQGEAQDGDPVVLVAPIFGCQKASVV